MKKLNRSFFSALFLSTLALANVSYANINVVYNYVEPESRDYEHNIYLFEPTFSRYTQPITFLKDWEESGEDVYWIVRTEMVQDENQTQFHLHPDVETAHIHSKKEPIAGGTQYTRFAFYEAQALLSVGISEAIKRDQVSEMLKRIIDSFDQDRNYPITANYASTFLDRHTQQPIVKIELYRIEKESNEAQLIALFSHHETHAPTWCLVL